MRFLVRHGASLGEAFIYAVECGHLAATKYLLSQGAKVNARGEYGETPLMRAARFGRKEIVKVLLLHGAKVGAKSTDGETAVDLARDNDKHDVLAILTR